MFDPTGSRVSSWWNSLRDDRIRFAPGIRVSIFRTVSAIHKLITSQAMYLLIRVLIGRTS